MMSHIISTKIYGLVNRKNPIKIKFNRDVNVICGPNGCGKTSIMKILASALSGDATQVLNVVFDRAEVSIYSTLDKEPVDLYLDKREFYDSFKRHFQIDDVQGYLAGAKEVIRRKMRIRGWKTNSPKNARKVDLWPHRYLPTSRFFVNDQATISMGDRSNSRITEDELDELFAAMIANSWINLNSEINRKVRNFQEIGLNSIFNHLIESDNESLKNAQEDEILRCHKLVTRFYERKGPTTKIVSYENFKKRIQTESHFSNIVKDIVDIEDQVELTQQSIGQFKEMIDSLWGSGKTFHIEGKEIKVRLKSGQFIPLSMLSSGEKQIVRILLEAVLAEENTLIIDEPEISMHIDWQKKILKYMTKLNSKSQIIAATHSPEIAASVTDDKISMIWDDL